MGQTQNRADRSNKQQEYGKVADEEPFKLTEVSPYLSDDEPAGTCGVCVPKKKGSLYVHPPNTEIIV